MNCRHCHHWNPEDEQRCRLCGRKLNSTGNDTTSEWALNIVTGNLATAPQPVRKLRDSAAPVQLSPQRTLFPDRPASNVIPFDLLKPSPDPSAHKAPPVRKAPPATNPPARTQPVAATPPKATSRARNSDTQSELDFLPPSVAPRTLKTTVEAVIFCDAPVATMTHRSLAGAIDFSLVLIGYGTCLASYAFMGGGFPMGRLGYLTFAAAFLFIALFYGLLWTLAKTETPGMRWTSLRLTNFDGFAPDPGQRVLRYFATSLSFASCGFGLLWALVDEENLTWQDHISKTFPTFYRSE